MQTITQALAHGFLLSLYLLTIGDSSCIPSGGGPPPLYLGLAIITNSLFNGNYILICWPYHIK